MKKGILHVMVRVWLLTFGILGALALLWLVFIIIAMTFFGVK
jgi:hypothetical protein